MNQIIKKEWIAALKSGKYKQGYRYLCRGEKNCTYNPFGVLLDACAVVDWVYDEEDDGWSVDNSGAMLPAHIANGLQIGIEAEWKIMDLNDMERKSFKEIASWIEKNL